MLGAIVNGIAIVVGGLTGVLLKGKIKEHYMDLVFDGLSLAILLIGFLNAFQVKNMLVVIFSIVIGSLLGQWWQLEKRLEDLSHRLELFMQKWLPIKDGEFSKGFVTTTLLYCIGSMAIVGSFESGLTGKHDTLFAKSALDGMSAVLFGSSLGFGTAFSAIPVFLYQGALTLSAGVLKPFLTATAIADMSATGGLIIIGLGLNLLKLKKISVANMLPAIFLPLAYYGVLALI